MQKINVMHIRDSGGLYGAERVVLNLGKYINKDRFNVMLLCMKRSDGRTDQLIRQAEILDIPTISVDVRGRFDLQALRAVRRIIKQRNVSLVHSHDFKSDFYAFVATIGLPVIRIATAHGSTRDSILKKAYLFFDEKFVYRRFHAIIAVSKQLKTYLDRAVGAGKVSIIQNGIDASQFSAGEEDSEPNPPLPAANGKNVFAVIGRLFPDKGHRHFLSAFLMLLRSHPDSVALIIGDGPARDDIAKQITSLGLDHAAILCGARSDMSNVYKHIDFLVIPSLTEGLPNVLLEAFASKVPVLATSVGDIPVLVRDGSSGYLVPPANANALAKGMVDLIAYPEKARLMAEEGYRIFQEGFTAQRMVSDTESLYERLLCA